MNAPSSDLNMRSFNPELAAAAAALNDQGVFIDYDQPFSDEFMRTVKEFNENLKQEEVEEQGDVYSDEEEWDSDDDRLPELIKNTEKPIPEQPMFPVSKLVEIDGKQGEEVFNDTKSRFTEYSMTSSVIRRNAGLRLVDDTFESVSLWWFERWTGF